MKSSYSKIRYILILPQTLWILIFKKRNPKCSFNVFSDNKTTSHLLRFLKKILLAHISENDAYIVAHFKCEMIMLCIVTHSVIFVLSRSVQLSETNDSVCPYNKSMLEAHALCGW